jgi:hypothetical protein
MRANKFIGLGILSVLLLSIASGGCLSIIGGTFVIDHFIDNTDIDVRSEVSVFHVDVTDEDIWKKHKEDIHDIDNVGFELWLTNDTNYVLTGELYIASYTSDDYTDRDTVATYATKVLEGIRLPASSSRYIDWGESQKYVANVGTLKKYGELGRFTVYATTETLPCKMTVDSARVIITVTGSR